MRKKALDESDRELLDELYRNSYRVVLTRTALKLGDYGRAEELLSQVYVTLVPRLHKLRRLDMKSRVAYTVATACGMCDELIERQENHETRYSYGGFELGDLDYLDGTDEEDKQILTERLDLFRDALSSLPTEDRLHLQQQLIVSEKAWREGRPEPRITGAATQALGKLEALLGQEGSR